MVPMPWYFQCMGGSGAALMPWNPYLERKGEN
jgi:hypothetical protein